MSRIVPVPFVVNKPQWLTDIILADIKVEVFCRLDRIFKDLRSLNASIEIGVQYNQQIKFEIDTYFHSEKEEHIIKVIYDVAHRIFADVLREKIEAFGRSIKDRGNLDKTSNLLIK